MTVNLLLHPVIARGILVASRGHCVICSEKIYIS
jgi:hypothetical protein